MQAAYEILFKGALIVIGLLMPFCLYRSIRGPEIADRLVAINMMTTLCTIAICILTVMLAEGFLADVAILFSLLGFLAVVLLTKIYIGVLNQKKAEGEKHVDR